MKSKIKILHVITHLPIGGAQDNTLYTVELLDKEKYDISLCCNLDGELVERAKKVEAVKLFDIPFLGREVSPYRDIRAFLSLYKLFKEEDFTIIHTHSSKAGLLARLAAVLNKTPIVIHTIHGFAFNDFMNGLKKNFFIYLEKLLAKWTDVLITVSNLNKKKIIDLNIAHENKIKNIYSGIDLSLFTNKRNDEFRKELNLENDHLLLGSVGRLSNQKDPITMIEAFGIISKPFPNAHLALVGDGELKGKILEKIDQLKLNDRIHLTGNKNNPWSVYHSMDLFIMSSIYEGLGRSITEALSCGVPVVCTDVEGVPEIVRDNITGILVRPKDSNKLADAIIRTLNDMETAKKMAEEGRRFVNDNFDVNKMVNDIDSLYNTLLS
ncbi:MAG: glycosyltransferase family 4 protein [Candidatus Neomarinimicrobiota bacterium]|jgi:glycosyltransferase involved in cell wall biosynthesis|uniref:Glycosyltransferase subfamily 4-like N-terminal domain-containing protein n=1 Tax=marine metagenome TaxID=408172 RepID=A0A381SUL6_9ZZZZ|nr:glycosyltransferase family 4 protein [Candidatus Neomarinimicrobiota bacterium]|tara:strand:- start:6220 stop:7362 length:1143 start_codon:yes stop_codon:yes gene_type:complete